MAAGGRCTPAAATLREAPGPAAGAIAAAEAAADEVVRRVRPTEASERRRAEVVDYARRLVGTALGCEVFAYGSVPLKTYLPDGDIDLTILGNTSHDSTLVNDVYCILDSEEQNSDAEFEVKNLDRINAEVRLIKCTIENITADISFNQTGGICALCFLELVDRKVGKDHLFKRSIILIKAWCYYESRLLGAHHGLLSTYALEILILYIFNLFHKSLHGPLEVLYRFLDYFSKFDWDSYCISLNGPVALSSLPNLIVEGTETHTDDLLFDKEFLKGSMAEVFVPSRDSDQSGTCYTRFRPKHINIVDPLKECNNLGRSVNRASFHRIRTAFLYGAQKLGQILILQSELIHNEIYGFFKNTLGRNGRGFRPDVASTGALHPSFGAGKDILEEISTMSICYRKRDVNGTPHDLSKSLGENGLFVTNGPTRFSSCLPEGYNTTSSSTDHGLKRWSAVHAEKQQVPPLLLRLPDLSGDLDLQFRCLRQVQYHLEYLFDAFLQSVQEAFSSGKFQERPFQIPNLDILLDTDAALPGLLLSSSVECNGRKLSPSSCSHSTEVVCQHSQDEDPWDVASQQNISLPYGMEVPSGGLSPSSCADSDSSVSWCCSSEDSPEMHGTDTSIPRKSYDTCNEQVLAPSIENGKKLANCSVLIETNSSPAPGGNFVQNHKHVALPVGIQEKTRGQLVKVEGCIRSDRKAVENHSCDSQKEFIRCDDKTRQIPKYHGDACLNMNVLQNQQYVTDMEFARTPSALRQIPKYQPFNRIQTASKDCTKGSLNRNLQNQQYGRVCSRKYSAGKQSYNNHMEQLSFVTGTKHIPCNGAASILNGIELEVNSNNFDENGNQIWPLLQEAPLCSINSKDGPPVSDTSLPSFPITHGPTLESIEFGSLGPFASGFSSKSKKVTNTLPGRKVLTDASASVVQRSRAGSSHNRSPEFCQVGNEDEFPPLNAGVR